MNLRLQVTELEGAEGKDQVVFLNSGEVKRDLMGSLAGPESPNPCSQTIKLRLLAIECVWVFDFREDSCWCEWDSSTNPMVLLRVIAKAVIGFANRATFISAILYDSFDVLQIFGNKVLKIPYYPLVFV